MIKLTLNKIRLLLTVVRKMSMKYLFFRIGYLLQIKTGLLKRRFPLKEIVPTAISVEEWKGSSINSFFFSSRKDVRIPMTDESASTLLKRITEMKEHRFLFFSGLSLNLGDRIDWHKNYLTGYVYPKDQHWSLVNDYSEKNGDIKFVWELSRFSYLYDFIRYDQLSGSNHSLEVFGLIENWIDENPLNQGPNYKCSQEISLRLFNWTFALYYYRDSEDLTQSRFQKISTSIYNQYLHVCRNINFSRIAVRNNHAITETLAVWLIPYFYPFFPDTDRFKKKGKAWFEEEVNYQIYEDGSYLQYSHNYQRVVIQLLTWALVLSKKNNDELQDGTIMKADKSMKFLLACQDASGQLPNYGSNDGALFFPLSSQEYPDFSPQLEALGACLGYKLYEKDFEDKHWYQVESKNLASLVSNSGINLFDSEGYLVIRDGETLTTMPCCKNRKRPFQADSLHLDIFYKGVNVFLDAGSYLYNTRQEVLEQFVGTNAHNTISINGCNQMERIGRFVWERWSECDNQLVEETEETYEFSARLKGFASVRKGLTHTRRIVKYKSKPIWKIIDVLEGLVGSDQLRINWHIDKRFEKRVEIRTTTENGNRLKYNMSESPYSRYYAKQQKAIAFNAVCNSSKVETILSIK